MNLLRAHLFPSEHTGMFSVVAYSIQSLLGVFDCKVKWDCGGIEDPRAWFGGSVLSGSQALSVVVKI